MTNKLLESEELELCRVYQTPLANGDLPTAMEIAQQFGCSDGTVRNILRRYQVPVRKNQGRKISRMFDHADEIAICDYYWTRLPSGYYPSYKEVAVQFQCSPAHVRDLLKHHHYERRTQAETREKRPCKPINQPTSAAPLCACGCNSPTQWMSKDQYWTKYAKGHYKSDQRRNVQSPSNIPWQAAPMKHGWTRLSFEIKGRDKWTCQLCGKHFARGSGYLHVHHIDQDRRNSHPHNLVSLCAKCHAPAHNNDTLRAKLSEIAKTNAR